MSEQLLLQYLSQLKKLRRDYKNGGAPHKPVLLLAICELIKDGTINDNRIIITPELVLAFKNTWSKLVATRHLANFSLPFFHMRSEPFWKLVCYPGLEIAITSSNSVRSFSNLKATVAWAEIDPELFLLMNDPVTNAIFVQTLLDTYFSETKSGYRSVTYSLNDELESQMVRESPIIYRQRIEELERTLSADELQEELYMRSGFFKREIPKIYGYTCAISGQRIESLRNAQMIDACHIVPFAQSKDDTITNGIALTPTLHRAFDRHLLIIDQDYRVRISTDVIERDSPFALRQFEGKQILLPKKKEHWPSLEGLMNKAILSSY